MMNDEFVKIPEYENYSVNRLGVVRNKTGKIITPIMNTSGYYDIRMQQNGVQKNQKVHRLLGIVFIPNPENKTVVDHIDRNKTNNSLDNLRWATCSENNRNKKRRKINHQSIDVLTIGKAIIVGEQGLK